MIKGNRVSEINLKILYQDNDIMVVSKPPYLLSVPGRLAFKKDSVRSRVQKHHPQAWEPHRLDWETSGIMVLGLNKAAHRNLSIQFQDRQTEKQYIAIVDGLVKPETFTIDIPICFDYINRPLQKVDYTEGRPSQTIVTLDKHYKDTSRLFLTPVTGRSHQLRLHLAHIGHAILGDGLYATPAQLLKAARLMLHAEMLGFTHPVTGKKMTFTDKAPF